MRDVLCAGEVEALLEAIGFKKITGEDREKYRKWLNETPLDRDEKTAIQFLTKIAGLVLVRYQSGTPTHPFTAYEDQKDGTHYLVGMTEGDVYRPSSVLTRWEFAENDTLGLRGDLARLMQRHVAVAFARFIRHSELAHKNDPRWLKKKAVSLMRMALSMEKLKRQRLDDFLNGKSEE